MMFKVKNDKTLLKEITKSKYSLVLTYTKRTRRAKAYM